MSETEIARVQLRNEYTVYQVSGGYEVSSQDEHGQKFSQFVADGVLESILEELGGRDWKVKEAVTQVQSLAVTEDWPFSYGYKLHFFVQGALVILVALGRADFDMLGNAYVYTVHGP